MVIPKDGLRRRFEVRLKTGRLDLVSEVDHFAADRPIVLTENLSEITFSLETDNPQAHPASVRLGGLPTGGYAVYADSRRVPAVAIHGGAEKIIDLPMKSGAHRRTFTIKKTGQPNRAPPSPPTND